MSRSRGGGDRDSVLVVHHREISSPYSATVPHYLSRTLSASHTVHVLSRRFSDRDEDGEFPDDVVHHEVSTGEVPIVSGLLFLVASTLYAVALGARYRFDAVYAFQQTIIQGWLAARAGGSRFVVGLQSVPVRQKRDLSNAAHGRLPLRKRTRIAVKAKYAWAVGRLLDRTTEVVCLTDGIRETTELEYGVDLSEATVIGMGVDTDRFAVDATREPARGPDDTWVVTYVGSIGPPRGLEHVLDAVAATDRDVEFRVAGGGDDDYMASLRERARDLGIDDRVTWLGIVPHEEIPDVLADSDVAVSPLADIESYRISFPAKLLEYMASGTPVVATDIPAHRRLVEPGENGLLYDGTAEGLVDTLDDVIDGEADAPALGRAGRATAEAHDWDAVVAEHETVLFDRTVRRPRATPVPA
ncbi:glycosyltransferase family 4 protein [Halosimplex pelagicum]|uniref:Glycosyltransferase family 4 protein n=1 Tax=Halosimplex pelagicum TaxID=869886 RepID=A0A7D5PA49_9EURY|nr:glycosyltransferase family 4 protein [Halosimplex pelagicum]QLH82644.1 glycosyltransferase family 4 protein [Halosimplex pelagicum]